ncbi:MAG: peptidoglycan editing factor PgeF [Moraxellaceae bacterium]|nr:peptidoglycan editing factor PgeF [Pseudomonadales bacterium]MCB1673173.1 peptidoglycan editing factor PgeF [Pseudomonadales bacterium]MCP5173812.1 peptidoglycan editing factor PgeF [Moraxellaceae bacterium]MCP5176869.1 peptidoglycan editing factor PgeF [Moraxellaceae bacterium]HQV22072.1 peptidoglycan editing factor PgeF [Agitococcus sp.]
MSLKDSFIMPDWPAPVNVHAVVTTRDGGCSEPPFNSLNLAFHVGDEPSKVVENRRKLLSALNEIAPCGPPQWLQQVHGTEVVDAFSEPKRRAQTVPEADAVTTTHRGLPCVVMTADCLPVFFCDQSGHRVAVAHAGWRGLCSGILENTLAKFSNPAEVMCWLGPAIGTAAFEVGAEVREAFIKVDAAASKAFTAQPNGKYLADIYALARQRLMKAGIGMISGGDLCTVTDKERFFSYRREQTTGRMASIIWLA